MISAETRRKLSESKKGDKNPTKRKEVKDKIRNSIKDYYKKNPKEIKRRNKKNRGRKKSSETLRKLSQTTKNNWDNMSDEKKKSISQKISDSQKGLSFDEKFGKRKSKKLRKNISNKSKGRKSFAKGKTWEEIYGKEKANEMKNKKRNSLSIYHKNGGPSKKTRKKIGKHTKKLWKNPEYRKVFSKSGWKMDEKGRKKISKSKVGTKNPIKKEKNRRKMAKSREKQWRNDPQYKKNWIDSLNKKTINKKENKVYEILKELKSNFVFVGNGKKWFTANDNTRFNPDFINEKEKKIIEFFGTYWHRDNKENDKKRIKTYQQKNYNTLIIYENELDNNYNLTKEKIQNFVNAV